MDINKSLPSKAEAIVEYKKMKHFKKWIPWLIPLFVIANVIVFIITMYVNDCPNNSVSCIVRIFGRFSFQPFQENPLLGPSLLTLRNMGALDVDKVVNKHQGWRLITCMWLHGGVFHILANMFGILLVGIRLEQDFGFGFLLGFVFLIRPQFGWIKQRYATSSYSPTLVKSKFKIYQCISWLLALILLLVGFTVGLVALLKGVDGNDHCSWCHYLSCVPTSKWSCNPKKMACLTEQIGNQLNVTCSSNGKSILYDMHPTNSKIYELCYQICS
ncbi:hypothetical protein TSUD_163900 [Trifolium subterraneum]|uniref:RHOMBOID-like protein n=1 Tax=Trifolium subterraneum TaxID=3900 RepID=A0A2Z6NSG5_TRISU|nr:hypothetical protein TSUD_163900 [Trifolium subterraneum]